MRERYFYTDEQAQRVAKRQREQGRLTVVEECAFVYQGIMYRVTVGDSQ